MSAKDFALARAPLVALDSFEERACFVVYGEPRSKARPRFGRTGKVYSDKKQVANQRMLSMNFLRHVKRPIVGSVAISAVFVRQNHQRTDVDNMLKQLLDSANKVAWDDDVQVTFVVGACRVDVDRPRTIVCIGRDVGGPRDSREKTSSCKNCGRLFSWTKSPSQNDRVFCGKKCAVVTNGQSLTALARCGFCQKDFKRTNAKSKYCSNACRLSALHAGRRKKSPGKCDTCGTKTSRPEYKRCRECWRSAVSR